MDKPNKNKIWLEFKDLCAGAAFPIMLQLIISVSIIIFADYSDDIPLRVLALVGGEIFLAIAYIIFGKQNGIVAYRKSIQHKKKTELGSNDILVLYGIGEYAHIKGVIISAISLLPYIVFQFIQCVAPNRVLEFILKYAFGWAVYPFIVILGKDYSEWLNFVWILLPLSTHGIAYVFGGNKEKELQAKVAKAQESKGKDKRDE